MQRTKPINQNLMPEQLAYLAGLFDGEGSVGIYEFKKPNKNSNWQFKVEIANTKSHWSKAYSWHVQGKNSEIFCQLIKPYTIIKTNQIDACLYFRGYWGTSNKKQSKEEIDAKKAMSEAIKKMKRVDHAI